MFHLDKLLGLFEFDSHEAWSTSLFSIAGEHGFRHVLFGLVPSKTVALETAFLQSNYPQAWTRTYDETRLHYVDPVVAHCLRSTLPIVWKPSTFNGRQQSEFYEQACGHGLKSGISYPVHGSGGEFGILSFVTNDTDHDAGGQSVHGLAALSLLRDYVLESSLKFLERPAPAAPPVKLTKRELECLKWVMEGKSSWEISRILRCSEATVCFHVANLMKKFNVQTRQQAVVKAIKLGLIVP